MNEHKRKRLEAKGWKVGSAAEFLGLSEPETAFIDLKVELARWLKIVRKDKQLTQLDLAQMLGSSQSRVARMEGSDPEVSLDLLVRSLLALGVSGKHVGLIIAGKVPINKSSLVVHSDVKGAHGIATRASKRPRSRGRKAA
jgi:transcriptional regulator with XRE-family HTH domain